MGLLDFFKTKPNAASGSESASRFDPILKVIQNQARIKANNDWAAFSAYQSLEGFKELKAQPEDFKKDFLLYLPNIIASSWKQCMERSDYSNKGEWMHGLKLIPHLLRECSLTGHEFVKLATGFKTFRDLKIHSFYIPGMSVVRKIEEQVRSSTLTPELKKALELMIVPVREYMGADENKQNQLIEFLLQGEPDLEINSRDEWGKSVLSFLKLLDEESRRYWTRIFSFAKTASGKSTPSAKWLKSAQKLVDDLGKARFSSMLQEWIILLKTKLQEMHKDKGYNANFMRDENHDIVKGLIWCAGFVNDPKLNAVLDDYAVWAYKKKPGVGPLSARTGTAAMFAFSLLPGKEGVSRLSRFRTKIKNNSILKSINKILQSVADKNGVSMDEIEELSVPDFSIINNEFVTELADCKVRYNVESNKLLWERGGKLQKSIPGDIKEEFPDEIRSIKSKIKEVVALLPVITDRLEQSYLRRRTWSYEQWTELYLNHPLTSLIARKLIWHFSRGEQKTQALYAPQGFIDSSGKVVDWVQNEGVSVQLWHPIGFSAEEILKWRNVLITRSIVQPFKQAFREVYIITEAELRTQNYSNRFAAHILRQHQFAALCKQRSWTYHLMGNWDSHNTPALRIPAWNIDAEYYVNADWQDGEGNVNAMGIFNYITTDQVRFARDRQPIPLHDVPALVFSEVMRDIDLFVGVTSLGNDPTWRDGGNNFQNTYWHEYSFSELTESAKVRSQVLETIVPQLKIASRCSFDKKFLIVKGNIRTYKIHMGSGNILMEPDDQYLCIIAEGSNPEKVFLPFEGDRLLSIIISKALLLADDDQITDVTITRQIKAGARP